MPTAPTRARQRRRWVSSSATTSSCGSASATRPSRPTTRSALHSALTTASSVASTVAAKSGSSSPSASAPRAAGGREGEEDLAAAVVGDRAGAREPEAGAARDALELRGVQRRVGGDDDDAAAGRSRRAPAARVAEQAPDRHAVDAQLARRAEVRQHEHADGRAARDAARRADAALVAEAHHPGAGADGALGAPPPRAASASARPASAASTCTTRASLSQLSSHSATTGMTTSSTPTRRVGRHRGRHGAVEDAPDGHRRRQVDRRLDHAPTRRTCSEPVISPAPLSTATPAASGCARRVVGRGRHDRGHARARDAAPGGRIGLVAHHGDVADADARDVGDRVRAARARARRSAGRARAGCGRLARPSRRGRSATRRDVRARAPWPSRCPSSGATATDCTTRAARSGSACASPGTELPARAERDPRRARRRRARASSTRRPQHDDALLAVHDARAARVPRGAWGEWEAAGLPRDPGRTASCPTSSPHPGPHRPRAGDPGRAVGARGLLRLRHDDAHRARARGRPRARRSTWRVTAADLVLDGAPAAYACCRPPGHHVTRTRSAARAT